MQILGNGDAFLFAESLQVDYRNGFFVVRLHISAGISHEDFALADFDTIGLEAHLASRHHLQRGGIHLCHIAGLLIIGVDDHLTGITGDVGIPLVELDVAAVGDIHLTDAPCGARIHNLHLVRAVDNGIESATIDGDVVAHVAHFHWHVGISCGIDVAHIHARAVVVKVECALVSVHIALVEQVEAHDVGVSRLRHAHLFRDENHVVVSA